jgi:hypothetical protein
MPHRTGGNTLAALIAPGAEEASQAYVDRLSEVRICGVGL